MAVNPSSTSPDTHVHIRKHLLDRGISASCYSRGGILNGRWFLQVGGRLVVLHTGCIDRGFHRI